MRFELGYHDLGTCSMIHETTVPKLNLCFYNSVNGPPSVRITASVRLDERLCSSYSPTISGQSKCVSVLVHTGEEKHICRLPWIVDRGVF